MAAVTAPPTGAVEALRGGGALLKFGRRGEPHFRHVSMAADLSALRWTTAKKRSGVSSIATRSLLRLEPGQKSAVFRRNPKPHLEALSFSLVYSEGGEDRSLDLACKDAAEYELWLAGLRWVIANQQHLDAYSQSLQQTGQSGPANTHAELAPLRALMRSHYDAHLCGFGAWGQLGLTDKLSEVGNAGPPSIVRGLVDLDVNVETISLGAHHSAAVGGGRAYTWGHAGSGRLGHGDDIAAAEDRVLATKHALKSPTSGVTPSGVKKAVLLTDHVLVPREVASLRHVHVSLVACGDAHTLFAADTGALFATGCNFFGQLGTGDTFDRLVPVAVRMRHSLRTASPLRIVGLGCASASSAAIAEGDVYVGEQTKDIARRRFLFAFGCNAKGVLGIGDADEEDVLEPVLNDKLAKQWNVTSISCGLQHMAVLADVLPNTVLDEDMHLQSYGEDGEGDDDSSQGSGSRGSFGSALPGMSPRSSTGSSRLSKRFARPLRRPSRRKSSRGTGSALLGANLKGLILTWGWGSSGQLGHGDFDDKALPTLMTRMRDKEATSVSCGANHTAAIAHLSKHSNISKIFGTDGGARGSGRSTPVGGPGEDGAYGQLWTWGAEEAFAQGSGDAAFRAGDERPIKSAVPRPREIQLAPMAPLALQRQVSSSAVERRPSGSDLDDALFCQVACGKSFTVVLARSGALFLLGRPPAAGMSVGRMAALDEKEVKSIHVGNRHCALVVARKWIDDDGVSACAACAKDFTTFRRRHQCRNCGQIFCAACTQQRMPVMKHGYQDPVRVCDPCYGRILDSMAARV